MIPLNAKLGQELKTTENEETITVIIEINA